MLRPLAFACCLAAAPVLAAAQDNPLSTEVRQSWTRTWTNVAAMDRMQPCTTG